MKQKVSAVLSVSHAEQQPHSLCTQETHVCNFSLCCHYYNTLANVHVFLFSFFFCFNGRKGWVMSCVTLRSQVWTMKMKRMQKLKSDFCCVQKANPASLTVCVDPAERRKDFRRSSSERVCEPSPTGRSVSVKTYLMSGILKVSPTFESLWRGSVYFRRRVELVSNSFSHVFAVSPTSGVPNPGPTGCRCASAPAQMSHVIAIHRQLPQLSPIRFSYVCGRWEIPETCSSRWTPRTRVGDLYMDCGKLQTWQDHYRMF